MCECERDRERERKRQREREKENEEILKVIAKITYKKSNNLLKDFFEKKDHYRIFHEQIFVTDENPLIQKEFEYFDLFHAIIIKVYKGFLICRNKF